MKRPFIALSIVLVLCFLAGCGYFQKKDEPPPLPPIEETKPPLTMKGDYFKSYPWEGLTKPRKDGNDPDTTLYEIKKDDTLEKVAETQMGNPNLARGLADYNELTSPRVEPGDKVVIPNPIIGMRTEIMVKSKGQKDFGPPQPFDIELRQGDEYKLRFEPNANGYAYILREGPKGMELLYPAPAPEVKAGKKKDKKQVKQAPPAIGDWGKVEVGQVIEIPPGKKGFAYDRKRAGDRIYVFLSLRKIADLDDLRDKKQIKRVNVEDVMQSVRVGEVFSQGPYHLLRINTPAETLGFSLNITG